MIQEILVALSGHPSVLFTERDVPDQSEPVVNPQLTDLTTSEIAFLQSIGDIALYHRLLKKHLASVLSAHPSLTCRAVAATLLHVHLRRFQAHILTLESRILAQDTAIVGAYRNVPLSTIVTELDPWQRLIRWYWSLTIFIDPSCSSSPKSDRSRSADAAALIGFLRSEAQTGYEDVETAANELSTVAERTWLRLMLTWLLHGRLPEHGASDVMINVQCDDQDEATSDFTIAVERVPSFVDSQTAVSVLFIGRTLSQLHMHQSSTSQTRELQKSQEELVSSHTKILGALGFPISSTALARAVAQIRTSLSQNVLKVLLPVSEVANTLQIIRQFFLLGRGEFAVSLIDEAALLAQEKTKSMRDQASDLVSGLRSLTIKEGDLSEMANRVWRSLATLSSTEEDDELIDSAKRVLRLELIQPDKRDPYAKRAPNHDDSSYQDILIPGTKTQLTMSIRSPADLFLSPSDIQHYSRLHNHLLAFRKSQLQLSSLWRHSTARRPSSKPTSTLPTDPSLRKLWATCSSALLLLSEMHAHFEGGIITPAWTTFSSWALEGPVRDPDSLSRAHRSLLSQLTVSLLLDDRSLSSELRDLLSATDALAVLFARLLKAEDRQVRIELDRARKRTDAGMRAVVRRLRAVDVERTGAVEGLDRDMPDDAPREGWVPSTSGLGALLMKLDFARVEEDDIGV